MAKVEQSVSFSPREMEVLALAWQCFESEPKIDIKKLARLTGYTEGSAKVTMGNIKRKLKTHGTVANTTANTAATPSSTPRKPTTKAPKSGGKRAAMGSCSSSATMDESPTKKRKQMEQLQQQQQLDEEDEFEFKIKAEPEPDYSYGGYAAFSGYGPYDDLDGGY